MMRWKTARMVVLWTAAAAFLLWHSPPAGAAEIDAAQREAIVEAAAKGTDSFWRQIAAAEPYDSMGVRKLFADALTLCEARVHPERLGRLFELAVRMQDRHPDSPGFGNLRWYWRDGQVTDRNAVEFCMQDAVLIWRRHGDWLPEPVRRQLRQLMEYGVEGCLRHRVRTSYTNIAVLNASNLILLGELFGRSDAAEEGYRRLDAVVLWTWQFGTHEYCSPTYYYPDLAGLVLVEMYSEREQARQQARALAELLWTDVAVNWFAPAGRLAGPQSRSYDYLYGLGGLDRFLWVEGWLDGEMPEPAGLIVPLLAEWSLPGRLHQLSTSRFPRLVRQSWGEMPPQSRTHMMYADVTLGSAGAAYGLQDMSLTVDLPGQRSEIRCYFIADGREDPYGKKKYETGSARHMKALHLQPFWAAAQQGPDALGLAVYRGEDLPADLVTNVESHFVLRRPADGMWLGGHAVDLPPATPERPATLPVEQGQPLVLRYGTAGVAVRLVWARRQDATAAPAALVDDGNPYGAMRLTAEHLSPEQTAEAGAALWIRVGSGLSDDEAFTAWRAAFEALDATAVEVSAERLWIEVPGEAEPISILAEAPFGRGGKLKLLPEPSRAVLEWDGREIGRPLLESLEPVRSLREQMESLVPIEVPAEGSVSWEAEAGLLFPGMTAAEDAEASGGRYVWQPEDYALGSRQGTVNWPVAIARAGRYWLWGRVLATTGKDDSFYVEVRGDDGTSLLPPRAWHTGHRGRWSWEPVSLENGKGDRSNLPGRPEGCFAQIGPVPFSAPTFELPAGACRIVLTAREAGTRLDRLMITSDPKASPE